MKHFIYYNLHKHVFSVKSCKTQLVEHHSDTVIMTNCEFKVSQAGRNRVLKEKRKNVHAGVKGNVKSLELNGFDLDNFTEITYNPYKYDSFVVKSNEEPVTEAKLVILHKKRVFALGIKEE